MSHAIPQHKSGRKPNYDKFPAIPVPARHAAECRAGCDAIAAGLREAVAARGTARPVVAVECYPGVQDETIRTAPADPKLVTGAPLRAALDLAATRPFRVLEVAFGNWQQEDITRYEDDFKRPAQGD